MEIEKSYKILDLEPGVSLEEVRQAYRHLALIWHPDRYPQNSPIQIQAEAKFKEISHAYETLKTHLSHPPLPPSPTSPPSPPSPTPPAPPAPSAPPAPPTPPTPPTPTIPLGWLTGVFICYSLIAWILTTLGIPFWVWTFGLIAWFTITLVASEDSDSSQPWLISLVFAGAIAGWVLGKEVGGMITGTVWGMVGIGLGAIAGSETASKSIIGLLTVMGIAAIAGLIAGNSSGKLVRFGFWWGFWGDYGIDVRDYFRCHISIKGKTRNGEFIWITIRRMDRCWYWGGSKSHHAGNRTLTARGYYCRLGCDRLGFWGCSANGSRRKIACVVQWVLYLFDFRDYFRSGFEFWVVVSPLILSN